MQTTFKSPNASEEGYITRNRRWLLPLAATFFALAVPAVMDTFKDIDPSHATDVSEIIPKKFVVGIGLVGGALAGLGAQVTQTTSALIFRHLIAAAGVVALLAYVAPMMFGR